MLCPPGVHTSAWQWRSPDGTQKPGLATGRGGAILSKTSSCLCRLVKAPGQGGQAGLCHPLSPPQPPDSRQQLPRRRLCSPRRGTQGWNRARLMLLWRKWSWKECHLLDPAMDTNSTGRGVDRWRIGLRQKIKISGGRTCR